MLVTLLGIVTLFSQAEKNALYPMLVTGRPLVLLGIIASLRMAPVYAVMVIAPLLVANLNWAWTAMGNVQSRSKGSIQAGWTRRRSITAIWLKENWLLVALSQCQVDDRCGVIVHLRSFQ